MQTIEEASSAYGLITNLAQSGVDVVTLSFGNSKTPNEPDTRYYLDVVRQNPSLQTPFERKFYAMDDAKRAGLETSVFGHPLSDKERYALLAGSGGRPIQDLLSDAAGNYAKGLGLDTQQLAILGAAVGSIRAIKGGSSIPVPNAVLAGNGLTYKSHPKHTPGAAGNRLNAGIESTNSLSLFDRSVPTQSPRVRLAVDDNGEVHRFFNDAKDDSGVFHWSGSTADKVSPLSHAQLGKFSKIINKLRGE